MTTNLKRLNEQHAAAGIDPIRPMASQYGRTELPWAPGQHNYVVADGWRERVGGYWLTECTDWDRAEFRLSAAGGAGVLDGTAVNVRITGTKVRWSNLPAGIPAPAVRVEIVFPGDGEADQATRGWLGIKGQV